MPQRLGNLLVQKNLITPEQLDEALHHNRSSGVKLGSLLVKLGYVEEDALTQLLSTELDVPRVCSKDVDAASQEAICKISREFAQKYRVIPFRLERNSISVAMSDPYDIKALDEIGMLTGHVVKRYIASDIVISKALSTFYRISAEDARYFLLKQPDNVIYQPPTTTFQFNSATGEFESVIESGEFEGFGDQSDAPALPTPQVPMASENLFSCNEQKPSHKAFVFSVLDGHECAAMFNILERKGLITKEELMDEARILKHALG